MLALPVSLLDARSGFVSYWLQRTDIGQSVADLAGINSRKATDSASSEGMETFAKQR